MIRSIRAWLIGRRFKRMMAGFDARLAHARKKHQPVRDIMQERTAFVHQCLAASLASQRTAPEGGSR